MAATRAGGEEADLAAALKRIRARVDAALGRWLPPETAEPVEVHRAMRYSLFGGGKRLRPAVALLTAEAVGSGCGHPSHAKSRRRGTLDGGQRTPRPEAAALPAACALECVHTYSLIHDDLPAMDDDDLRRGRPTCHKAFGEATAILAGDGLLTIAFELIARHTPADVDAAALVRELAGGAGTRGMVGGQVLDMRAGSSGARPHVEIQNSKSQTPNATSDVGQRELDLLAAIHRWKTAALFRAAARMGAIAAGADARRVKAAGEYGLNLGLAFQVADDILDVTGTAAELGKTPGKDAAAGKLTYPAVHGLAASRAKAAEFAAKAGRALRGVGRDTGLLAALAGLVVARKS